MSLNTWSIIMFAAHLVFYVAMSIVIMTRASLSKLISLVLSWVLWMIVTLWYGTSTDQVGFILIFIFQFIVTLGSVIFSAERYINENQ